MSGKEWNEMSQEEKDAAILLGWNEHTWQSDSLAQQLEPTSITQWGNLTTDQRLAALILGYTQTC